MEPFVIGVDGGGTRTTAVVMDEQGAVLAHAQEGPSNPHQVGWKTATACVAAAVNAAAEAAGRPPTQAAALTLALAGVDRPDERERWRAWAAARWPGRTVRVEPDALAALVAGVGKPLGVVVVAGTGMIAYGVNEAGQRARAGGWGYRLDEGSGYAMGLAALRAVAAAHDGTDLPTALQERVLQVLGLREPEDVVSWVYGERASVEAVAALAPHVVAVAEQGDPVAVDVVARAADALADAALAVARRLDLDDRPCPFVLAGGLLEGAPFFQDVVRQALLVRLPLAQVTRTRVRAAEGAAWLAWESLGRPLPAWPPASETSEGVWTTERPNVLTRGLDARSALEIVGVMHVEDRRAVAAVRPILPAVAAVVEECVRRLRRGGRLIYVGAGTSGRLGLLDASECPPTFNTPPDMVIGIMAGGERAFSQAVEGAEDDDQAGREAVAQLAVNANDVVVGISASGRTPFVRGALEEARRRGAYTVALVNNHPAPLSRLADQTLAPLVGPEVIAGSTRLKAGTAQKLVLNMLSTATMVRLGKVYDNLMVDVRPENEKLRGRARRILMQACGVDEATAAAALAQSAGDVKVALVSLKLGCSPEEARTRLRAVAGHVRQALEVKEAHPDERGNSGA